MRAEERDEAEDARLVELRALVSRVVAARVRDRETASDVVQETLARVLRARDRVEEQALAPYAVVTARNLVRELGRVRERERRHAHRLLEPTNVPTPEDEIVRREEEAALAMALSRLPARDRQALTSQLSDGADLSALAEESGSTPGALAVRLSRARARLRVEYVLALRRVELPTARCKSVLLALSSGDRRRQEALEAGEHLLGCACCAELSAPLLRRSSSLVLLWPVLAVGGLIKRLGRWARGHPVHATGATAGVAAVTVAVILVARPDPGFLRAGQQSILPPPPAHELATRVAQPVEARAVKVESVVSPTGFWVGPNKRERLFVEVLAPPPFPLRAGDRVSFVGFLDVNHEGSVQRFGLRGQDAAQLEQQGSHIHVEAHALRVG